MLGLFRKKTLDRAHLLLLSKFLDAAPLDRFVTGAAPEAWGGVLGEHPRKAIKDFQSRGLIELGTIADHLECALKLPDLKALLKERGQRVSGKKADLIARFIEADPRAAKKLASQVQAYRCTPEGVALAEDYLRVEQQRRNDAHMRCLGFLSGQQFLEAAQVATEYKANDVFPTGLGIDWRQHDPSDDVLELKDIWSAPSRFYGRVPAESALLLTHAAGMWHLFGLSSARHIGAPEVESQFSALPEVAVRQLVFYAWGKRTLRSLRSMDTAGLSYRVRIVSAHDSCPACQKVAGKTFTLDNVPVLPLEGCTHPMGCRCGYTGLTADD